MEKRNTEVIYLRGNHDDLLARVLPIRLHNLHIREDYVLDAEAGRYLVVHGDVFDVVTRRHRYLAVLGSIGYQWLLQVNRFYNRYRAWRGRGYYSLSRAIKARVKDAVSFIGNYESQPSGAGRGSRVRRGDLRTHPYPGRQTDRRRPLPELRRLGRVPDRARGTS